MGRDKNENRNYNKIRNSLWDITFNFIFSIYVCC